MISEWMMWYGILNLAQTIFAFGLGAWTMRRHLIKVLQDIADMGQQQQKDTPSLKKYRKEGDPTNDPD